MRSCWRAEVVSKRANAIRARYSDRFNCSGARRRGPFSAVAARLILGDRGYQSIDYCREVDAAGGYVLIRYQTQINPVVVHCVLDGRATSAYRDGQHEYVFSPG